MVSNFTTSLRLYSGNYGFFACAANNIRNSAKNPIAFMSSGRDRIMKQTEKRIQLLDNLCQSLRDRSAGRASGLRFRRLNISAQSFFDLRLERLWMSFLRGLLKPNLMNLKILSSMIGG